MQFIFCIPGAVFVALCAIAHAIFLRIAASSDKRNEFTAYIMKEGDKIMNGQYSEAAKQLNQIVKVTSLIFYIILIILKWI